MSVSGSGCASSGCPARPTCLRTGPEAKARTTTSHHRAIARTSPMRQRISGPSAQRWWRHGESSNACYFSTFRLGGRSTVTPVGAATGARSGVPTRPLTAPDLPTCSGPSEAPMAHQPTRFRRSVYVNLSRRLGRTFGGIGVEESAYDCPGFVSRKSTAFEPSPLPSALNRSAGAERDSHLSRISRLGPPQVRQTLIS